jgi:16S rRNA (cytosine967-C5)-methyltransferase
MHPNALIDHAGALIARVLTFSHPADATVAKYFRDNRTLGPRERATVSETAYKVVRFKARFEYLARSGPGARERKLAILGFHGPREFIASSLTKPEAAWLAQCDAAQDGDFLDLHKHNLPQWLVDPLKAQVGEGFMALADALNTPATLDIRVNALKAKREAVQKALLNKSMPSVVTPYSPWGLRLEGNPSLAKFPGFEAGDFEVQDEGSQLLAALVGAKRGEMVADFCAGAGGKTLAMGADMRSTGRLYAFDTSAHRLDALKPRLARSGLSNVQTAAISNERDERVKRLSFKMDRVLVDAPCSGTGTMRRNPDLKWRLKPQEMDELVQLQKDILDSASNMVKPGGRLVYATCSLLQAENEGVADAFTAAHDNFEVVPVSSVLSQVLSRGDGDGDGADAAQVMDLAHSLCSGDYLRLWPHVHATDGFFAAIWTRKS